MKKIYLAYGSNMSLEQMFHRCPGAEPVGKGYVKGWRLMFKGSCSGNYATIEPDPETEVPVVVWAITEADEKRLDRFEGFPSFYVKKTLPFDFVGDRLGRRAKGEGIVYVMPPERSRYGLPNQIYRKVLLEGYSRFGFNEIYIYDALNYSMKRMKG